MGHIIKKNHRQKAGSKGTGSQNRRLHSKLGTHPTLLVHHASCTPVCSLHGHVCPPCLLRVSAHSNTIIPTHLSKQLSSVSVSLEQSHRHFQASHYARYVRHTYKRHLKPWGHLKHSRRCASIARARECARPTEAVSPPPSCDKSMYGLLRMGWIKFAHLPGGTPVTATSFYEEIAGARVAIDA